MHAGMRGPTGPEAQARGPGAATVDAGEPSQEARAGQRGGASRARQGKTLFYCLLAFFLVNQVANQVEFMSCDESN